MSFRLFCRVFCFRRVSCFVAFCDVVAFCKIGDTEEDEVGGTASQGAAPAMHMDDDHDEHHGLDEASLKEHEEVTKVKV